MIKPKKDVDNESFKGCVLNLKYELDDVFNQYDEMMHEPKGLPPNRGIQHKIELQKYCPLPKIGMYKMLVMESTEIKIQIQNFLNKGIIKPYSSLFGSPIVLVSKKDGTWHMCADFCALNKIMVKNCHPLP